MQPIGDRAGRQRSHTLGSGGGHQRVHAAVRHVAVTMPALDTLTALGHHVVDTARLDKLLVELRVATDAVVHDDLGAGILGHDGLTLAVGHEISGVLEAVHRLEAVFGCQAGVWYMAVVACRVTAMRGMAPCGIIWRHDVTVHAGRRVIGDIGMRPEQIHEQSAQTHQEACSNKESNLLLIREATLQCFQSISDLHQSRIEVNIAKLHLNMNSRKF